MRMNIPSVVLALLLSLPMVAQAAMWSFAGALNADQERTTHALDVPDGYLGGGLLSATLDDVSGSFLLNAFATGLTGDPVGAHIHAGAPGVAGPILIDLGTPSTAQPGILGYTLSTTLTADQVSALTAGGVLAAGDVTDWYVNVHTAANTAGEIRGQLVVAEAPAPIPLPAGVWLLGSALLGLRCLRRRA